MQNYGIQCVEIAQYSEILDLLKSIERRIAMKSVMVSGSFPDSLNQEDARERQAIESLCHQIGKMLVRDGLRVVSGFGLVVGSALLSGALDELNRQPTPNFERSLFLRPFPQIIPGGQDRQEFYRRYRTDLATQAGACIFISGKKDEAGQRVTAQGVISEYEIAIAAGRVPIPIGATGGAAAEIWNRVSAEYQRFFGTMPRDHFDNLNNPSATTEALSASVQAIIRWAQDNR